MTDPRVLTWQVSETRGIETAWVEHAGEGALRARGRAVGTVPEPYWLEYRLDAGPDAGSGYVTRSLRVLLETADQRRELDLRRADGGEWTANGAALPALAGALDCDLGLCPLTNTMPVLRHGLHRHRSPAPGAELRFRMAFIQVPELTVRPAEQSYTPFTRTAEGGARIRYASGTFNRYVEFDADGFVVNYPGMAHRLRPNSR
ncbi:putative glycolipid-binding domain-containing protein [Phaeacidiphilus oryzae]|jgi:hypothetical protein|uniref:putative glycolipid-binding domain-containing protein n=1 Tax=Phaeacidiphilus oryzae TaxID=348818 RepID=UPI00056078A9|nr:putative glycolipid-binding domain-containing protein [Phaeacidiphilus oryzae]